jgi:hypothetical protein
MKNLFKYLVTEIKMLVHICVARMNFYYGGIVGENQWEQKGWWLGGGYTGASGYRKNHCYGYGLKGYFFVLRFLWGIGIFHRTWIIFDLGYGG